VREQLELLLTLSSIDSELQAVLAEHESLPGEIAELEEEKERLGDAVTEKEGRLDDIKRDRQRLERELEDLSARLRDLTAKQLAIKTNEEYAALSLEIEHAKRQISETEDAILRQLELADEFVTELAAARETAADAERDLESRISRLRSNLKRLDDAVAVKRDERLRVATRVDPHVLERYDRILASKGDAALAQVLDGACSGCRIKLPAQFVIEVKRADRLRECQSCGRILFWRLETENG
jgi:predicted  nucleic acid-binding Zn-ribbon protein